MKYSKKKYLDFMLQTLDALNDSNSQTHFFINNPGFGNIFDILKNERHHLIFIQKLEQHYGNDYAQTIINSLKRSSLNSFYTPEPIINAIVGYTSGLHDFEPKTILEPCAGNGAFIAALNKVLPDARFTAFEKEILTVRILEHNFKYRDNVTIYGIPFENLAQTDAVKNYDLVVSNIPFGASKIFDTDLMDHPLRTPLSKNIHSYFMYKSLDCLKPSGIAILICTKNFMDKSQYARIREYLMKDSNFIGGVRLPDSAFAQENTAIVTDILVFQNNGEIKPSLAQQKLNTLFTQSSEQELDANTVQISDYFSAYPSYVIGQLEPGGLYNNQDYTVRTDYTIPQIASEITPILDTFIIQPKKQKEQRVLASISQPKIITEPKQKPSEIEEKTTFILKPGNLTIKHQKVYKLDSKNELEPLVVKPKEFDRISKIIALRNTYLKLLEAPIEKENKIKEELDYQYEAFNFQYGRLNDKPNYHFVTLDIQGPMVLDLETPKNGVFIKSELFNKPKTLVRGKDPIPEPPKKLSLEDAVYYSLNKYNKISSDTLSEKTDLSKEDVIKETLDRQLLFLNPTVDGWELSPKFLFLSGTIYEKINAYRKNDFGAYQSYVDKSYIEQSILILEKVKPPLTPFEDLGIKLHEPWFPIEYTRAFIHDVYKSKANIAYNDSTSKYMVNIEKAEYTLIKKFTVQAENRYYGFTQILEGALNSTIPYITKGSAPYKRTDKAKMQEIRIKFDLLYKEFNEYILGKPELKKQLEEIFYNTYDAQVNPKYDGDYLNFEGLRHFTPYKSQKDTVAGIIINQGLLVNKEVGFGKTLDIALSTQKLKELSLSKKTLVIGLRSTIVQLERELLNAFPSMRLLVANDNVVKGIKKRKAFFKKIANSFHDVVLMSHDTFKFIPQSPEVVHEIIQEELDNLTRDLSVIYENNYKINKRVLKGLEQRKDNLEATLQEVYYQLQSKQSDTVDFADMGFEHIMVDESHKFKNLMYTTRHNRVAGLNTSQGSERSKNLLVAIRTLQKKKARDFQATFLSGTPISNSITEVYVLFKYLVPHRMAQMNITSFDQWAQVFANKSYEFEPTVSGDFKVRERFRSFKKMKLLSSLYNEISIIVNGTTHEIDRPKMQLDIHTLTPTTGQLEYFERIKTFLSTGNSTLLYGGKAYTKEQKTAISLIALHHMRNASIDPRLLNQDLEDPGDAKLRKIAAEVYATYKDTDSFKGTQAIFSDIGVPKENFNVYGELKRILVEEYDIPQQEVVFIHDFGTDAKRMECFKQLNAGDYRVIIGSTEKLGTGTNIQERLVRIHHVDIPHRPTDIDQRNGRGVRKGNIGAKQFYNDKVIVSFYIVENCTDALMLNNVNVKKNFIDQLTNGTIQFNNLDTGAVNDEGSIDYKTLLAVAKNDPLYLEKEELAKQLDELELEQSIFKKNRLEAENSIRFYETELKRSIELKSNLENDLPIWKMHQDKELYYDALRKSFVMKTTSTPKQLGEFIMERIHRFKDIKGEQGILVVENMELMLKGNGNKTHELTLQTQHGRYGFGSRQLVVNPSSMADYMYNALSKIPKSLETQKGLAIDYEKVIKANQKVLELHFEKTEQLELAQKRLVEINIDLDEKYDVEPELKEEANEKKSSMLKKKVSNQNITL